MDIKIYAPYAQGSDMYPSDFDVNPDAIAANIEESQAKPVTPEKTKEDKTNESTVTRDAKYEVNKKRLSNYRKHLR